MNRNRRSVLYTLALTAGTALAAGFLFMFAGVYNVAADQDHTGLVRRILDTTKERSVAVRADDLPDPPPADSAALEQGLEHFRAMCVDCHGAPGVERGEIGLGMNPRPPELSEEARELGPGKLFWTTKHGIKLAGMPAFGPTHSDDEIRGIVAFLGRLAEMGPEEYAGWVERLEVESTGEDEHVHAPGTPDHSH